MASLADLRSGAVAKTTHLRLAEDLAHFPAEILDLAETLEILDLSGNQLAALPPDFSRLKRLRILFCSGNRFDHLPEVLGECPDLEMVGFKSNRIGRVSADALPGKLRWLILTDNQVAGLPQALGSRSRLQKAMLAGNRLTSLPESLEGHGRLELLRIAANRLASLPPWLFALPRLAWLASSGNPGSWQAPPTANRRIPWREVELGGLLGQGASGETFQAAWRGERVAVKVYKGHTTSDGTPQDEMATCLAAGTHPHLAGVLGELDGHGEGKHALCMELLPEGSTTLGDPPDFQTCTRDTFPQDRKFALADVERIAGAIASVCRHLSARGISHGDLYAHNILVAGQATYLTDFGAANRWDPSDPRERRRWEGLEARAYGCLLDDLLSRCEDPPETHHPLAALRDACLDPHPSHRPAMASWPAT